MAQKCQAHIEKRDDAPIVMRLLGLIADAIELIASGGFS
jgi:hypothetical protein